jgi:hypothetical protein
MAPVVRTRCDIELESKSVKIGVKPGAGASARQLVPGVFDSAAAVNALGKLPLDSAEAVQAYGRALFDLVLAGERVKSTFLQCEDPQVDADIQVCIRLWDELAPELRSLRWETLCDRTLPNPRRLAVDRPFRLVRRLMSAPEANRRPLAGAPRVLVVLSNPKGLDSSAQLGPYKFRPIEMPTTRSESKALDALMNRLKTAGKIQDYQILGANFAPPHPAGYPSLPRIREVIDEAQKAGRPHNLIHFLAHGFLDEKGTGHLVLADENGNATAVAQDRFLDLLPPGHQVRLVVLAACQSDEQAVDRPLAGLAPSLLQRGVEIPAVVAMQDKISVGAARTFAEAFYTELCEHGYVDTAMARARSAVANSHPVEWAIPVLYMQNDDPRLFDPQIDVEVHDLPLDLFTTKPLEKFVDRGAELAHFTDLLCEQAKPAFCWLWGPNFVGKQMLLDQLRFKAYQQGYGHLIHKYRSTAAPVVTSDSKALYDVLSNMIENASLHQSDFGRSCVADFLQPQTVDEPLLRIIKRFLDGMEKLSTSLPRGLICLFYFFDYAACRALLKGAAFTELVGAVTDRYEKNALPRVRFLVAAGAPQPDESLYPGVHDDSLYQEELRGFKGPETIRALCNCYGLLQGDRVPADVLARVEASKTAGDYYLPGPPASRLSQLSKTARFLGATGPPDIQWVALNGGGGGP